MALKECHGIHKISGAWSPSPSKPGKPVLSTHCHVTALTQSSWKDILDLSRFDAAPFAVKAQIVLSLEHHASEESAGKVERTAQALFLLAQCHIDGFGLQQPSDEEGLEKLRKAARLGHTDAQEIVFNIHQGIGIDLERSFDDEYRNWMTKGINSGSRIAANSLLSLMSESGKQWQEEELRKVEAIASRVLIEPTADKYGLPIIVDEESFLAYISQDDFEVTSINADGDSMLHWAAAFGLDPFVSWLIDQVPDLLDNQNILLETPLLTACRHGQKSTAEQLLNSGAKIDAISLTGETPLHWLVSFPDDDVEEIGRRLWNEKAMRSFALANTTLATGHFGDDFIAGTPMHRAISLRRRNVIQFLLDKGGDAFFPGEIMFDCNAIRQAGFEPIDEKSHKPSYLPVHWVCQAHDAETILLLAHTQNQWKIPDWPGKFRMMAQAATADHMPEMTLSDYLLPIGVAASRGKENQTEWFKAFQDSMGNIEDGLGCPLFWSRSLLGYASDPFSRFLRLALYGEKQKLAMKLTIQLLLDAIAGQQLDKVSWSGRTAIMQAVENNDTETVLHLLGMDRVKPTLESSYQGGWGIKPLHAAARNNNLRIVRALIDCGADPRAEMSDGTTALQICASMFLPEQEIAKFMIEKAPELVNRKNIQETPFATAVRNHDFNLANFLIRHGADVNALLGPSQTNTVLFQIVAGCSREDLLALRYLLSIPDVDFVVAPRQKCTALHAAITLPARYAPEGDMCAPSTPNFLLEALLEKWKSHEDLMMKDYKGCTALHHAAIVRDLSAMKQLVEAMENASADINGLTDYFGSPVHYSVLDFVEQRKEAPESVISRGQSAVRKWDELTEEMKAFLTKHNAKLRQEILQEKWNSLSFFEKQKAQLLSNQDMAPIVYLTEYFDAWRSFGPDVKTTRARIESERNPWEIRWKT
jgi:ankyrin repeat protein